MVSYTIGGRFKYTLPAFWPFRTNPHWFSGAQAMFAKWGASAVIVSKFTGPLRAVVPVAAGAMHMPARSFMTASSVSCLLWSGALLTPGYYGLRLVT
jgi:membrane protein DedA with SNARE-associated domain